jgi:tetratricopeptide (TPR) repeat protein
MTASTQSIPLPSRHFVDAAVGWLMLGNPAEALAELKRLPPEVRRRSEVLDLYWEALSEQKHWDAAFAIALEQVSLFPDLLNGWIHRAYAARRKEGGGIPEAFALLLPAVTRFPEESMVRYNLACYTAQLDRLDEAWAWFCKALAVGEGAELRAMALADDDLRPLWPRIAVSA